MSIKYFLKQIMPPIILNLARRVPNPITGGFKRGFNSWHDASTNATTYNSIEVFQKTLNAARLVRDGKIAYERDSVLFDQVQYDFKLLSSLLLIANIQNQLNVVDFGGAPVHPSGKTKSLDLTASKKWAVVEQRVCSNR